MSPVSLCRMKRNIEGAGIGMGPVRFLVTNDNGIEFISPRHISYYILIDYLRGCQSAKK